MTLLQSKILITWFVGPITLFMVFGISNQLPIHWSFVLLIGFGVCGYLRSHLPKEANNIFKIMQIKSFTFTIIYFAALTVSCVWLYLERPDIIKQNPLAPIVILLVLLPFVPSLIKHEHNLYKKAGTKSA